jgi:hypothetical protein
MDNDQPYLRQKQNVCKKNIQKIVLSNVINHLPKHLLAGQYCHTILTFARSVQKIYKMSHVQYKYDCVKHMISSAINIACSSE